MRRKCYYTDLIVFCQPGNCAGFDFCDWFLRGFPAIDAAFAKGRSALRGGSLSSVPVSFGFRQRAFRAPARVTFFARRK
jgi:hypothetical protein